MSDLARNLEVLDVLTEDLQRSLAQVVDLVREEPDWAAGQISVEELEALAAILVRARQQLHEVELRLHGLTPDDTVQP